MRNLCQAANGLPARGYRCLCCPCYRQHCMYCCLRNKIHRCSRINTVCWLAEISFPFCLTRVGRFELGKCVIGMSSYQLNPVSLISCPIHAKLLLTFSRLHVPSVSVRQIWTEMANRHFLGAQPQTPALWWRLKANLRYKQVLWALMWIKIHALSKWGGPATKSSHGFESEGEIFEFECAMATTTLTWRRWRLCLMLDPDVLFKAT